MEALLFNIKDTATGEETVSVAYAVNSSEDLERLIAMVEHEDGE